MTSLGKWINGLPDHQIRWLALGLVAIAWAVFISVVVAFF